MLNVIKYQMLTRWKEDLGIQGKKFILVNLLLPSFLKLIGVCEMLSWWKGFDWVKPIPLSSRIKNTYIHESSKDHDSAVRSAEIWPASVHSPGIWFRWDWYTPKDESCRLKHSILSYQHNDRFRSGQPVTRKKCREIFDEASRKKSFLSSAELNLMMQRCKACRCHRHVPAQSEAWISHRFFCHLPYKEI